MEQKFEQMPTCFALSPLVGGGGEDEEGGGGGGNQGDGVIRMAVGFVDGSVELGTVEAIAGGNKCKYESGWSREQKRAIRSLLFAADGATLWTVSANRGLCSYDVETGKRTRVIRESHDDKPLSMYRLPPLSTRGQQFVTGDESGQIRSWDWRVKEPIVCTYDEQEESINAFAMDQHTLLAASSDGTLGAYEMRKRKLLMCSELMHSELLSIAVSDKFTYVGSGDGHVEVFNKGEYGNLLERIESGHGKSVSACVQLRRGLLLTGSDEESELRLLHTEPNRRLGVAATHGDGGVDQLATTADDQWIVSLASFDQSIRYFPMQAVLEKVPLVRADSIAKKKKSEAENTVTENFFDDLIEQTKKDESEDDDEEEEGEGEEEEEEEDNEDDEGEGDEDENESGQEEEDDDDDEEEDEEEVAKPPQGKRPRLK